MTTPLLRHAQLLSAAIAFSALAACGGGSSPPAPAPAPVPTASDLSVVVTGPADVVSGGQTASWTATITNTGPAAASGIVISNVVDGASTISDVHCAAAGDAKCPTLLGSSMLLTSMPPGGSISLKIDSVVKAGTNGTIFEATTVSATDDPNLADNSATASATGHSSDLTLSNVAQYPNVNAGTTAIFFTTVANDGGADETNVKISDNLSGKLVAGAFTCVATGTAVCPTETAFPVIVPDLPVNSTLTFNVPVAIPIDARGAITSTVTVKSDTHGANLTATATTNAVNAPSGAYQMYAANGNVYTFTVDLDALTYTVSGGGVADINGTLKASKDNVTFKTSSTDSFSDETPDLLVGGFDFGAGTVPFIAARIFAMSPADMGTAPFTTFGTGAITKFDSVTDIDGFAFDGASVLTDCVASAQIYTVATCPTPQLRSYVLTFSGADITGFDEVNNVTIHFRVAMANGQLVFLRSETDQVCACAEFQVGLTDNTTLLDTTFTGASTIGAMGTLTLTDESFDSQLVDDKNGKTSEDALITSEFTTSPVNLLGGVRSSDSSFIWVLENSTLVLQIGARTGPDAGVMEVWVADPPVAASGASVGATAARTAARPLHQRPA